MKKILFFLLLLFCIPFSIFGINGDGSFGSPYNGPLTTNMTWSGTVYVNGDVTVNGFSLTISPGAIIIFLASGADLIITGNGVLTASGGTGANMIRFTADFNNNGIFGETGERWGHISFQNMTPGFTTQSIINYCIIEFGQKSSSPWNFESSGGGIQTAYTYLTISNSILRNNYAGWGGGIYINLNSSPQILNCLITNNTAGTTGGGMSIYQHSAALVENCIIFKNTCNGGGSGGGVFVGDFPDNVKFYNCTIVSNSSTSGGINIRIWQTAPSTGPQFFNTIVWGSPNSINYLGLGPDVTDFNYCAIQGYTTGYNNCINLNATNNNPAGPNFYNITAGSEDYRINYVSPCRDAGTSTGAPATDILGNSRIGNYDIGAYEVQYSRWTGATSTSWLTQTNWVASVDPTTGSGDVVIPTGLTNYPTGTPAPDFTIGSGKQMILNPGAKTTLGSVINNGILKLESDSISGFSSLIAGSYSGNNATIELYLTGGGTKTTYKWHYISTPVSSLAVSTFSPTYTLDLAQWVESRPSLSLREGWVAFDGYIYDTGGMGGPAFSTLNPGKGYDYYRSAGKKYTFSGQLNTGNVAVSLGFSGNSTLNGFNLLGNPFSTGLNWDDIINNVYFPYPVNTSKGLYFTRDNAQCSYVNGVGIPVDVNGIIPPMQGFFTKTYSSGNTITFPAAARIQNGIHPRYKSQTIIPLVRLALTDDTLSDETVVRFDDQADPGLDNDFDAVKMFLSPDITSIYTISAGTKFAINGQPFPDPSVEIPIEINLTTDIQHQITATQLQGLDNYNVRLIDNLTGLITNLKTTPVVQFNALKGTVSNRFILKVCTTLTGIENPSLSSDVFNIYSANSMINIRTFADNWDGKTGSVKVLDLAGKTIIYQQNIEFTKNSLVQVPAPKASGIYFVELKSGAMKFVGKIIIR